MSKEVRVKLILIVVLAVILAILLSIGFNMYENRNIQRVKSDGTVRYVAKNEIKNNKAISNENYVSEDINEIALLICENKKVSLLDVFVDKTGGASGEDYSNPYGINSGVLVEPGANLTMKDSNIVTSAEGSYGIFALSDTKNAAKIEIENSRITTTEGNSTGIILLGESEINASNVNVSTSGISSIAIKSSDTNGKITIDGGTYKTVSSNSPVIYTSSDVDIKDAVMSSKLSEGIVIEGSSEDDLINFSMEESEITVEDKNMFYITNSSSVINLINNIITLNISETEDEDEAYDDYDTNEVDEETEGFDDEILDKIYLLKICSTPWEKAVEGGSNVILNASNQELEGDIFVDENSTLEINLTDESSFEGAINEENIAKSVILNLDLDSEFILTADTYVTELNDESEYYTNIITNGYDLYVNGIIVK